MIFLRSEFGFEKQRDYTESLEINEVFFVSSVVDGYSPQSAQRNTEDEYK